MRLETLQGRVAFHQERIFRSAGGPGHRAHARYLKLCEKLHMPEHLAQLEAWQCIRALRLIQLCARAEKMHYFRDVNTDHEKLARQLHSQCIA